MESSIKIQTKEKKHKICVFCGAKNGSGEEYKILAEEVGEKLGKNGFDVVYGGGRSGLMGIIAHSAHENNAYVTGVYPVFMKHYEPLSHDLDNTVFVDSMAKRKDMMIEMSDVFLILPGGFGTLDELFEILTLTILERLNKKIIIVNYNKYWDPLLSLMEKIIEKEFAAPAAKNLYFVCETAEEAMQLLKKMLHE